ncbi:translation elongation factor Ts [candidate division WWE3 bacterium CG08_land_8_20_14_0_20_43_13]|uniref:Elongation factor Ts n=1 Tax=candidate division WWE3 bacterium CG08_land_8_20_14_0_20_43_13 TaxID=1975087 RepID=A0A2H0X9G8_UNCKA|nr:MAG: translation elongation factor Ts [candidate division WWE3 bacterium CG08_land_8_20_14_0_20_43_13]
MSISLDDLKVLRAQTGAGVLACRSALEESDGDMEQAIAILKVKGLEKAAEKSDREIRDGLVVSYIHSGGKIGSLVKLGCETDFVARMDEFKELATNIAQQAAAMAPSSVDELLEQSYIRDPSKTVGDLVTDLVAKVKENIVLVDYYRLEV